MPRKKKKKTTKKKVKKKTRKRKPRLPDEIKPNQIILKNRIIFIYGSIGNSTALNVNKELITLDRLERNKPIMIWINSPGGSITDTFSIIDTMRGVSSPVVTMVSGMTASAASIIAACGDKRLITENSVVMCHDGKIGMNDYFEKIYDRVDWVKSLQNRIFKIYRDTTEMTEKDYQKIRQGELWLSPKECLERKIVDKVIGEVR